MPTHTYLFMYTNICTHNTPLSWHSVFSRQLISFPSPVLLCRITIMKLGLATLVKHLFNPPFHIQLISAQIISREQLRPFCQQHWRSHKQEDNKKSYYQLGDEGKKKIWIWRDMYVKIDLRQMHVNRSFKCSTSGESYNRVLTVYDTTNQLKRHFIRCWAALSLSGHKSKYLSSAEENNLPYSFKSRAWIFFCSSLFPLPF